MGLFKNLFQKTDSSKEIQKTFDRLFIIINNKDINNITVLVSCTFRNKVKRGSFEISKIRNDRSIEYIVNEEISNGYIDNYIVNTITDKGVVHSFWTEFIKRVSFGDIYKGKWMFSFIDEKH